MSGDGPCRGKTAHTYVGREQSMNAAQAKIVAAVLKSAAKTAHKRAKALAAAERLERDLNSKLNVVAEYNGKTADRVFNTVDVWAAN